MSSIQGAFGLPGSVTLAGAVAVPATVVWLPPIPFEVPAGGDLLRRELRKVVSISRAEVPVVPRGTRIDAAERLGDAVQAWKVDEEVDGDPDQVCVSVVAWVN